MAERYFEGMEGEASNEEDLLRAKEIINELLELPGGTAREAFSNYQLVIRINCAQW